MPSPPLVLSGECVYTTIEMDSTDSRARPADSAWVAVTHDRQTGVVYGYGLRLEADGNGRSATRSQLAYQGSSLDECVRALKRVVDDCIGDGFDSDHSDAWIELWPVEQAFIRRFGTPFSEIHHNDRHASEQDQLRELLGAARRAGLTPAGLVLGIERAAG